MDSGYEMVSYLAIAGITIAFLGCLVAHGLGLWLSKDVMPYSEVNQPGAFQQVNMKPWRWMRRYQKP